MCVSTYFPAADSEEESQDIRLLLLLKLFDVFEGTHLDCFYRVDEVSGTEIQINGLTEPEVEAGR